MLNVLCESCKEEISEFGGILLSPPDSESKVKKIHLCKNCYRWVERLITEKDDFK